MPKGLGARYVHPYSATWTAISAPKSHDLAAALRDADGKFASRLGELATAADPHSGAAATVKFPSEETPAILEDLTGLLRLARERNHPAAGMLEELVAQM